MKRKPPFDDDICTIDAERIAKHLDATGWPRFAAFVRSLDGAATSANRSTAAAMECNRELHRRLRVYEPEERTIDPGPTWTGD